MGEATALARTRPSPRLRDARFEDVPVVLRLIDRAVAAACGAHYDAGQRAAVCAAYAGALFVEALGPFDAVVAELDGRVAGFAQLDASSGRLRALFVDAAQQGRGLGRALLAEIEARAARAGRARVHGAMALNAVPFYERAGYRACGGQEHLASMGVTVPVVRMDKLLGV
jgi:GNAT superfamily N-acetyltransferase